MQVFHQNSVLIIKRIRKCKSDIRRQYGVIAKYMLAALQSRQSWPRMGLNTVSQGRTNNLKDDDNSTTGFREK